MSHPIILPAWLDVIGRWQKCLERNDLRTWRSLAFMLSSAASVEKVDGCMESSSNLLSLFEVAMQHVFDMQPK